jgi:hypothetical protein
MARRIWLPLTCFLALLPAAVFALWLGAATAIAQDKAKEGAQTPLPRASVALEEAFRFVKKLSPGDTLVLAAQGTPEGHWRFVNQSGEMFTVGTPDEMKRVVTVLYPETKPGARLALYMTEDTVLGQGVRFRALPPGAERYLVVGGTSYRLSPTRGEPLYAQVRPTVGVEVLGNPLLKEALGRLDRPLAQAGVRVLTLEPGGPKTLPTAPPADAGTAAQSARLDPVGLADALAGLSGQTLVVCARGEGDLIYVRPAAGPERSLAVGELMAAANKADVALIVLQFASPLEPACPDGGRPAAELTLADILDAAIEPRQAPVAVALAGRLKALDATVVGDLATGAEPIRLGDARQRRRGRDLIADIPFPATPAIYVGLLLLGWLGTPVATKVWGAVWRVGDRSEYPSGGAGYWAARTVSFLVFALVFQPLTAVVTAPVNLVPQIWRAVRGPVRALMRVLVWFFRLGAKRKPVAQSEKKQIGQTKPDTRRKAA